MVAIMWLDVRELDVIRYFVIACSISQTKISVKQKYMFRTILQRQIWFTNSTLCIDSIFGLTSLSKNLYRLSGYGGARARALVHTKTAAQWFIGVTVTRSLELVLVVLLLKTGDISDGMTWFAWVMASNGLIFKALERIHFVWNWYC